MKNVFYIGTHNYLTNKWGKESRDIYGLRKRQTYNTESEHMETELNTEHVLNEINKVMN